MSGSGRDGYKRLSIVIKAKRELRRAAEGIRIIYFDYYVTYLWLVGRSPSQSANTASILIFVYREAHGSPA